MKIVMQILLFVCCALLSLGAQELPPVQNFAPAEYAGENQNWAVSQSDDKHIYVANNKGLLVYNGARWETYASPNNSIMRSVRVIDNKVYTGSYMEFGYWQPDNRGVLKYTSLSRSIQDQLLEDEEFWTILPVNGYILFQSLNRIYIHNLKEETFSVIHSESRIPRIFAVGQEVYFQKMGEGLFRVKDGEAFKLSDEQVVQEDEVVSLFNMGGELRLLTRQNGFFRFHDYSLEKWWLPNESLFEEISVYSALQLEDNHLALGTIAHGLLVLDAEGREVYRIDEIKGLRNNTVLSLFQDNDHNLWLGLDNGIAFVNLKSPFRVFKDNRGIVGSVYAAAINDNKLYLGTNQGLFYRNRSSQAGFQLIEGTQGQVWSLSLIGDTLFCGHHTGTFIINGDQASRILEIPGTWKVSPLADHPDLLLLGNYNGLYVLNKTTEGWKLRNKIEGFDNSARYFEEFNGELFVNHEYKGIFRMQVDESFTNAREIQVDTTLLGNNSGMIAYQDELLYACPKGIFSYDLESESFVKDSILSQVYSQNSYVSGKLSVDDNNDYLWVFTQSGIQYIANDNFGKNRVINHIPLSEKARNSVDGYESVIPLPESGQYLFGTSSGYITADLDYNYNIPFSVGISSIKKGNKVVNQQPVQTVDRDARGDFSHEENYLQVAYHTTQYRKYLTPEYQYQLLGMYPDWTAWSPNAIASFENLPHGKYTFNVRGRLGETMSTNIASFEFRIARPWYLSIGMIIIYVVGALIGSFMIHRTYRQYYRGKQNQLVAQNQQELELIRLQNEKDIIKLKNEQLQEDFRNKSNELAASTMSIIKKNELLTQVKNQLQDLGENGDITKRIVTIIDRSLKQSDDWELFQEAFNNADREFLGKLKEVHPNLTPNDIRLCSYLRLNLTSKEIAQLLNISPRSVEIKRYRLRKKMDLQHDENLVNYILQL